jgi:hypothetical protein
MQPKNINEAANILINVGLNYLKDEFPAVNENTIITDLVYKQFFKVQLENTLEALPKMPYNPANKPSVTMYKNAIKILLAKINK